MEISIELTFSPLQDNFEPPIIEFITSLRESGFHTIENPLSTQIFGNYDDLMPFITKHIKVAMTSVEHGLMYMKIVKSNRKNYEPHF
jgi:uncharacterized protein YqgV (UPF0045/DUF77 family)